MLRKVAVAAASKPHVEIRQDGDQFYIKTSTTVRTTEINFKVGEGFEEETVDGRKCRVSPALGIAPGPCAPRVDRAATRTRPLPLQPVARFSGRACAPAVCRGLCSRAPWAPEKALSFPFQPRLSAASPGAKSRAAFPKKLLQRFAATPGAGVAGAGGGRAGTFSVAGGSAAPEACPHVPGPLGTLWVQFSAVLRAWHLFRPPSLVP